MSKSKEYTKEIEKFLKQLDEEDLLKVLILLRNTIEEREEYAALIKSGKFVPDEALKEKLRAEASEAGKGATVDERLETKVQRFIHTTSKTLLMGVKLIGKNSVQFRLMDKWWYAEVMVNPDNTISAEWSDLTPHANVRTTYTVPEVKTYDDFVKWFGNLVKVLTQNT
jgi:hypothetical protein